MQTRNNSHTLLHILYLRYIFGGALQFPPFVGASASPVRMTSSGDGDGIPCCMAKGSSSRHLSCILVLVFA